MKDDKLIDQLLNKLIASETDPGKIHTCPICDGELHVQFAAYKRFDEDMFGVQIECMLCNIQMAIDYGGPLPVWLKGS